MDWIVFALAAPFVWAIVNIVDKILVSDFIKSASAIVIIEGFVGLPVAFALVVYPGITFPPNEVIFLIFVSGGMLYAFNFLYYRALEKTDATMVAIMLQTAPIFTVIWGVAFFAELFDIYTYVGVIVVILAGFLAINDEGKLGFPKIKGNTNFKVAIAYMLPGNFLLSLNYAIQKYSLDYTDANTVFSLARIGGFIFVVAFYFLKQNRTLINNVVVSGRKKEWTAFLTIEILNLLGIYLITMAYKTGPVSLVTPLTAVQPIFVAIIGLIFGLALYGNRKALSSGLTLPRLMAILLMIVGIAIIARAT